jgi:hypothetical protein
MTKLPNNVTPETFSPKAANVMTLRVELVRDILLIHGDRNVRVLESIEVEVQWPEGIDPARGIFKRDNREEIRGAWQVVRVLTK